jgi:acylphosphatase
VANEVPIEVRRRVVVSGRVQGVFFRASCTRAARAEGVTGWVRNRSDGTVEAVFEGPEGAVQRMVAWCADGPPEARVTGVEVVEEDPTGEVGFRS